MLASPISFRPGQKGASIFDEFTHLIHNCGCWITREYKQRLVESPQGPLIPTCPACRGPLGFDLSKMAPGSLFTHSCGRRLVFELDRSIKLF
jgi:hypothetical protein